MKSLLCLTGAWLFLVTQNAWAADLQLVITNVVSGGVMPSTDMVVRKISAEAYREDNLPALSRIILLKKGEQITLNHFEKTYARQPLPAESDQSQ